MKAYLITMFVLGTMSLGYRVATNFQPKMHTRRTIVCAWIIDVIFTVWVGCLLFN